MILVGTGFDAAAELTRMTWARLHVVRRRRNLRSFTRAGQRNTSGWG